MAASPQTGFFLNLIDHLYYHPTIIIGLWQSEKIQNVHKCSSHYNYTILMEMVAMAHFDR